MLEDFDPKQIQDVETRKTVAVLLNLIEKLKQEIDVYRLENQ